MLPLFLLAVLLVPSIHRNMKRMMINVGSNPPIFQAENKDYDIPTGPVSWSYSGPFTQFIQLVLVLPV